MLNLLLQPKNVLIVLMGFTLVAANVLVFFFINNWLTWGTLVFPIAFFITDISNRFYGAKHARIVVYWGFLVGSLCGFIGTLIPNPTGDGTLVSFRVVTASALGFVISQFINIAIFQRLIRFAWWIPPLCSSFIGSIIDSLLFFGVAFSNWFIFINPAEDIGWANALQPLLGVGPEVQLWVSLGIADWLVKISVAMISLIPFGVLVKKYHQSLNVQVNQS